MPHRPPKYFRPKPHHAPRKPTPIRPPHPAAEVPTPPAQKKHSGVTRYDPEFALVICERIATTPQSVARICEAPDMPGVATIFRWVRDIPDFRDLYVQAREAQAELLLDQALEIVDDSSQDLIYTDDGRIIFNRAALQRCKMRVEHRKWIASKLLPRKYGSQPENQAPAPRRDPRAESPEDDDDEVITEEYRMQIIEARRQIIENLPPADDIKPVDRLTPNADLRSPNPIFDPATDFL